MSEIPVPIVNYVNLIKNRRSPYYEIIEHILKDMEMHYYNSQKLGSSETVYAINPRQLQDEIKKKVQDERLTTVNVCRTILAMMYGAELNEDKDYFVTTTSSGRRNYHIVLNPRTLNSMGRLL